LRILSEVEARGEHEAVVNHCPRGAWDEDARVWVATSNDVEGLAVEAETLELLEKRALAAISDLTKLNGIASDLPEISVRDT
jgi:hypothetical protein